MKLGIWCVLVWFGAAAGLISAEVLLRLRGETPGNSPVAYHPEIFRYKEPFQGNASTGWQLKPGMYHLELGKRGRESTISINSDGSRSTGPNAGSHRNSKIIFLGDSFVFGEGLDDQETLPWKLQELRQNEIVINHAVGGFGTCQVALLTDQIQDTFNANDLVVYGLSGFHEERNTADPRMDYWNAITSPTHTSGYPRCAFMNQRLVREDPKLWGVMIPFTGSSVVARNITNAWLRYLARGPISQQRELTWQLIEYIRSKASARGAVFLLLLQEMSTDSRSFYRQNLSENKIAFVDGSEIAARKELQLPDGHPGPEMTALWAAQLNEYFGSHQNIR